MRPNHGGPTAALCTQSRPAFTAGGRTALTGLAMPTGDAYSGRYQSVGRAGGKNSPLEAKWLRSAGVVCVRVVGCQVMWGFVGVFLLVSNNTGAQ